MPHVSLWCLLAAPLIFSGDITRLDEFTLGLLCNDEVIEVDQDPLGRPGRRVAKEGACEVWAKEMEDGSLAVGLFNRGEQDATVTARWSDLGLSGPRIVRDLWRQKDLGTIRRPVPGGRAQPWRRAGAVQCQTLRSPGGPFMRFTSCAIAAVIAARPACRPWQTAEPRVTIIGRRCQTLPESCVPPGGSSATTSRTILI